MDISTVRRKLRQLKFKTEEVSINARTEEYVHTIYFRYDKETWSTHFSVPVSHYATTAREVLIKEDKEHIKNAVVDKIIEIEEKYSW